MRLNPRQAGLLALITLTSILTLGCPGTDSLNPTTGNLEIRIEYVNQNQGRATPFHDDLGGNPNALPFPIPGDANFLTVGTLLFRPVDSAADTLLGSLDIGALPAAVQVFLTDPDPFVENISLSTGVYELIEIELLGIDMFDTSDGSGGKGVVPSLLSDSMNPVCSDFIQILDLAGDEPSLIEFGGPILVNIDSSSANTLTITLDAEALVDAILAAHSSCFCPTDCPGNYNFGDTATYDCNCFADGYNSFAFRSASASFLSFD